MSKTDKAWAYYGKYDPYFGVLTDDRFRRENLDDDARSAFFESGEDYIKYVLTVVREHLDPRFKPTRALDFGCGVGRLTLPLARRCEQVVGVDISNAMLAEAAANALHDGVSNIDLVTSDDGLSGVAGKFDLIHSFIVFQHMLPERGEAIVRRMVERLHDSGVGILHFTYANSTIRPPPGRRTLTAGYIRIPLLHGIRNVFKGQPFRRPPMEMNLYNLNSLLRFLQESGCHDLHIRFTEASHFGLPVYGVILFFLKKRMDVTAHH